MTSRSSDRPHDTGSRASPRHAALLRRCRWWLWFSTAAASRSRGPSAGLVLPTASSARPRACATAAPKERADRSSGWGKPCGACDAQDGNGRTCACDDGALLTNDFVTCVSCPDDCGALDALGRALDCAAECPTGSTCSAESTCLTCQPGMCGGSCGNCPYGEVCQDGFCFDGIVCCLSENKGAFCSEGADFCIVPPVPSSPGSPCYCNVVNHDEISSCQATFTGFRRGAGSDVRVA